MADVRLASYYSVLALPVSDNAQNVKTSAFVWKEPYLAKEKLTVDTVTPVSSSADLSASANGRLLRVQCDPGVRVHYEVTVRGATLVPATTSSPILSGDDQIEWQRGWTLSLLQVI